MVNQHTSSFSSESNLNFAYEIIEKLATNEISDAECRRILENHNINYGNSCEYYNSQRLKGNPEKKEENVYELLLSYIEHHRNQDYYIDEMPILLSSKSKFV